MNSTLRSLLCLALLPVTASALPTQPKSDALKTELIQSLAHFRLGNANAAWHLTATVQLLNDGKPGQSGTMELFHAADGATRTVYAFSDFHQAATTTAQDRFREGDEGDAPAGLRDFLRFLEKPADMTLLHDAKLKTFSRKTDGVDLHCIHTIGDTVQRSIRKELFCTIDGSPAIRYASLPLSPYETFFEKVTTFQGGEVPETAVVFFDSVPIARLQLAFSPLSAEDSARMQPASTAVRVHGSPSRDAAREFNRALVPGFQTDRILPTWVSTLPSSSMLLRFSIDAKGKIINIQTLAATNNRDSRSVAAAIRGLKFSGISTPRVVNVAFLHTESDSYDPTWHSSVPLWPATGPNSMPPPSISRN